MATYTYLVDNELVEATHGSFHDSDNLLFVTTKDKTTFRVFNLPDPETFSHLTGGLLYDNMILYKMRYPLQGWSIELRKRDDNKWYVHFLNTHGVEALPKNMLPFYQKLVWLGRKYLRG